MNGFEIIVIITLLLVFSIIQFVKYKSRNEKTKSTYKIPSDIEGRIISKWPINEEQIDVFRMIREISKDNFNVGKDQLIRSILIIADNDKSKIRSIIDENYYGDPRDVIMEAMRIKGNTNDHGMSPFQNSKQSEIKKITPRKLDIYSEYLGDIDSFAHLGRNSETHEISDEDWYLIDELISEIIMVKNNLTSNEYKDKLNDKIRESCFDSYTIEKLESIALKLDSYDKI